MSLLQCRFSRAAVAASLSVAVLYALWVSPALGGPIPPLPVAGGYPPLPPGAPISVAGESDLPSFIFPAASDITVDWMVVNYAGGLVDSSGAPIPAGGYLYAFQIENTSAVAMDALSLTFAGGTAPFILGAGQIPGDDLDLPGPSHPAHSDPGGLPDGPVPGPFPVLVGEEGPFPMVAVTGLLTTINALDDNITWTFNPVAAGLETNTLFYVSSKPPIYGNGVAQDSTPPSPWGSLALGGDPLPIPDPLATITPEPSSWVLVGIGAAILGAISARRRR